MNFTNFMSIGFLKPLNIIKKKQMNNVIIDNYRNYCYIMHIMSFDYFPIKWIKFGALFGYVYFVCSL